MEIQLDQLEFLNIKDVVNLMSNEQLLALMIDLEDQLIYRGQSDKVYEVFDEQNDGFKNYSFRKSELFQSKPSLKDYVGYQGQHYGYNKSTDKWKDQKNITWQQKKKFDNVTDKCKKLFLSFNAQQTARLYALLLAKPSIEWGLYLVFPKKLPSLDDIWLEQTKKGEIKKKQSDYIIDIGDMVIVPQNVSSGDVDYLEQEYPELMKEVNDYRFKKWKTTGRIHSHHNMSAYHSNTDWGEFDKYLDIGDVFLSVVVATNNKFDKDIKLIPENSKKFFNNVQFDLQYGIPEKDGDILGYITNGNIMLTTEITQEEFDEAKEYVTKYDDMLGLVEKTKITYEVLRSMADTNKIDEMEERELRQSLIKDDTTLKSFNILSKVTHEAIKEKNKTVSDFEEARNIFKTIADKLGLIPKVTTPKVTTSTYPKTDKRVSRATTSKDDKDKSDKKYSFVVSIIADIPNMVEIQQLLRKKIREYGNSINLSQYTYVGADMRGLFVLNEQMSFERMQTIVDVVDRGQKVLKLLKPKDFDKMK